MMSKASDQAIYLKNSDLDIDKIFIVSSLFNQIRTFIEAFKIKKM